jgi:hypothetical protein
VVPVESELGNPELQATLAGAAARIVQGGHDRGQRGAPRLQQAAQ